MAKKIDKIALRQKIQELQIDNKLKSELLAAVSEQKTFGLVWEDKPEEALDVLKENIPVFKEDESKRIVSEDSDAPNHIIIEGDNLHALTSLCYTHEGKIDVIYIDPPYNTGNNDFVYNDKFIDKEDGYRHSKWLSFMDKRLRIAKKLLSDRGVIFISIDDNEQANLKLLCDEVFGDNNFVTNIIWQSTAGSNTGTDIVTVTENIVVYSKFRPLCEFDGQETDENNYTLSDEYEAKRGKYALDKMDRRRVGGHYSETLNYPIEMPDGTLRYPGGTTTRNDEGWNYLWSKAKVEWGLIEGFVVFKRCKDGWNVYNKRYSKVDNECNPKQRTTPFRNLITSDTCNTAQGTAEVTNILEVRKFDFPKPSCLITRVLKTKVRTAPNSTILDFFAGSGTTLHATMQLNSEDGGHRQCILVTNNENNICEEVTYERNKRVIQGYTTPKGVAVEGLTNNNLRYYKTEFVPRDNTSANRRALMSASVDLLCIKENIYTEQENFGGRKFKKSVLRYFEDGDKQMLVVLNERVISLIIPMIADIAKKESPMKVFVFSDGQYAYEDEFHEVMPLIDLCALPDAIYQALNNVLPEHEYSEKMIAEFNQEDAEEALQDTYYYKSEEGGIQ